MASQSSFESRQNLRSFSPNQVPCLREAALKDIPDIVLKAKKKLVQAVLDRIRNSNPRHKIFFGQFKRLLKLQPSNLLLANGIKE